MATETGTATVTGAETTTWKTGVLGGLVGGVVFGAMMTVMMPDVIQGAIPAMYGLSGGGAGWFLHMSHAAVLGVAFAAAVEAKPSLASGVGTSVGAGVVYGVILWVVLAAIVMPLWVGAVTPAEPPLPNLNVQSLVGHVVYGAILGGVYAGLSE
ncbi:MAG: histidine kinase [Haloferacaceae archaeon]